MMLKAEAWQHTGLWSHHETVVHRYFITSVTSHWLRVEWHLHGEELSPSLLLSLLHFVVLFIVLLLHSF